MIIDETEISRKIRVFKEMKEMGLDI